jgi:hypothetical protein
VSVSGYVTFNGGYGNTAYDEFMVQDTNGNAIAVYLKNLGGANIDDSNTPPFGSFVSVQGEVQVYNGALEIDPLGTDSIIVGSTATNPITPHNGNLYFNEFATNGSANYIDTNFLNLADSLLTFTNVYLYSSSKGAPIAAGTTFPANGSALALYMFIGPYSTNNTHYWEDYQRCPIYGGVNGTSVFANQPVPSYCYQLTASFIPFGSTPEIIPSRLVDYVTNAPAPFPVSLALTNKSVSVTWNAQAGSTYSVLTSTNLSGPWTKAATGLGYIPTNGSYFDKKSASYKFYELTSP